MTETTEVPKIIQEQLDSLERVRQNILDMIPFVGIAEELIAKFKTVPGTSDWRISIGYGTGILNGVLVHVDALDLRELVAVRRWLREQGFPAPTTDDQAEIGRRSWTYTQKDQPNFVFSGFTGYSWEKAPEGQKCQFVKVGMKEPEPIYELQCDGKKWDEETNNH